MALDGVALDGDIRDLAVLHIVEEIGIGNLAAALAHGGALEQIEQRDHQQSDDHPERKIATKHIHGGLTLSRRSTRRHLSARSGNSVAAGSRRHHCLVLIT